MKCPICLKVYAELPCYFKWPDARRVGPDDYQDIEDECCIECGKLKPMAQIAVYREARRKK